MDRSDPAFEPIEPFEHDLQIDQTAAHIGHTEKIVSHGLITPSFRLMTLA
jgi:hypothetical protein